MKAVLALLLIALLVICAQSRRAPGYNGPAVRPRWPKLYAKRLPAVEADEEDEEESEFWTALIPVAVNLVKSKLAKKRDSVEEESDFINWKKVWGVAKDIGKTYLSNKYGINLDEAEEEADLKLGKFFKKAWGVAKDIGKNYLSTKYGINLDEEDEEEADQNRSFDFGANVNGRNWNVNAGLTGQTRNGGSYNVGGNFGNGGQWGVNGGYDRTWNNGRTSFGGNAGYGSGGFNAGIKFTHRFDDIEEEESDFINWKKVWGVAKDIGKTYLSSKYGINLDEAEEESDSEFIKINWKKIGNIAKDIGKTYLSSKYGINLDEEDEEESDSMDAGSSAAAWASQQVGKGYSQSNRLGPNSFDCSGLIYTAYRNQGISVPSYTGAYPGNLKRVYGEGNLRAGDILYRPGHVAMYVGGGQLVQAANPRKGVVRTSLSDYNKYWGGYTAIYRP